MHTLQCRLIIGPPRAFTDTSILFDQTGQPMHYALCPDNQQVNTSVPVTVSFPIHHSASILCLQYDDDILVTGSSDSTCIIYNVRAGYRPVRRLQYRLRGFPQQREVQARSSGAIWYNLCIDIRDVQFLISIGA